MYPIHLYSFRAVYTDIRTVYVISALSPPESALSLPAPILSTHVLPYYSVFSSIGGETTDAADRVRIVAGGSTERVRTAVYATRIFLIPTNFPNPLVMFSLLKFARGCRRITAEGACICTDAMDTVRIQCISLTDLEGCSIRRYPQRPCVDVTGVLPKK